MGQRRGLLEMLCLVLLGWTLVRCQAETMDLKLGEEDPPVTVEHVELQISCPEKCSCSEEGAVDCNGVSLTEFPQDLSEQTRQLSLQVGLFAGSDCFPMHTFPEYLLVYLVIKSDRDHQLSCKRLKPWDVGVGRSAASAPLQSSNYL